KRDIQFYINSPGGSVSAGLGIIDTMRFLRCDVATTCIGMAASMGACLLAAGTKGKRAVLPNSQVMLHQPLIGGVLQGPATDLGIEAQHMLRLRDRLYHLMANFTANTQLRKDKQQLESQLAEVQQQLAAAQARIGGFEQEKGSLPTLSQDRLDKLITVHGIKLGRLTGGDTGDTADAADKGLKIYLT